MSIEPRAVTKQEAAEALAISVDVLERLIGDGRLRVLRLGRKVIVPVSAIDEFIDAELEQGGLLWFDGENAGTTRARSTGGRRTRNG